MKSFLVICLFFWVEATLGQSGVYQELSPAAIQTSETRGQLEHDLFQNYSKENYPTNPTIQIKMSPRTIDVVRADELVLLQATFIFSWYDYRLRWDPTKYSGIQYFIIDSSKVWVPDLSYVNAPHRVLSDGQCEPTRIIVNSNGELQYTPSCNMQFYSHNITNLDSYPNGPITVFLQFDSWVYLIPGMTMGFAGGSIQTAIDLTRVGSSSKWIVVGVDGNISTDTVACCPAGQVSNANFYLTIQRQYGSC